MRYKVTQNKFHGDEVYYDGKSEIQAIKAARQHDCIECQCGGPKIIRDDGSQLFDWHVTPPFECASIRFWEKEGE